jgi:glycosyltransferase involved in cell wall biosynthesis
MGTGLVDPQRVGSLERSEGIPTDPSGAPGEPQRKLTLLHCIQNLSGGGAERQLTLIARAQARRGHAVHVALVPEGPNLERLIDSGVQVHPLPRRNNHHPAILADLNRVFHRVRPDVVHSWLIQMDVLAGLVACWDRTPMVLMEQNSAGAYQEGLKSTLLRPLVGRFAEAIVANSKKGLEYWRGRVGGHTRLPVVRNGLAIEEIDAAPVADLTGLGIPRETPLVLFVGRLVDQKNLGLLVDAMALVAARMPATLFLCGEGPNRAALTEQIRSAGLQDRVVMPGYRSDAWALMKRAEVFVNPSLFEGQPNTVVEAMACGCPLVVSDIPEHREFLDESGALFFPLGSPGALAEALIQAITDPDATARRRLRALEDGRSLAIDRVVSRYEDVYALLLPVGG